MSADNWTRCPRCVREAIAAKEVQHEAARAAYGTLPVEEFDRLRADAEEPVKFEDTVREDYEFYGFEDGTVVAVYEGTCQKCGLSTKFRHEQVVYPSPSPAGEVRDDE